MTDSTISAMVALSSRASAAPRRDAAETIAHVWKTAETMGVRSYVVPSILAYPSQDSAATPQPFDELDGLLHCFLPIRLARP